MQEEQNGFGDVRPTNGDRLFNTAQSDCFNDGNTTSDFNPLSIGYGGCIGFRRFFSENSNGSQYNRGDQQTDQKIPFFIHFYLLSLF
ncbi:MAG: hypothetical protein WBB64_06920 [Anaerolineales bacterium]